MDTPGEGVAYGNLDLFASPQRTRPPCEATDIYVHVEGRKFVLGWRKRQG